MLGAFSSISPPHNPTNRTPEGGPLSEPLLLRAASDQANGGDSGSSLQSSATGSIPSPLPPSASRSILIDSGSSTSLLGEVLPHASAAHRSVLRVLEAEGDSESRRRSFGRERSTSNGRRASGAPPGPTSWYTAACQALPITLMNVALAHVYAHLICIGTPMEPAFVAAMHIVGMIVVQCFLLPVSGVARFAIASPDVTVALLSRAAVVQICALPV